MHTFCFKLTPFALAAFLAVTTSAYGQDSQREVVPADAAKSIPTVTINASADASAEGLSKAYSGGQVARGGHLGLLGNVDAMSTPFNTTNYTQQLIQDQQARGVADVLQNDPSVRIARGFGNFQELYMIRGFAVSSDDIGYNGLYGLLPRQFVASELLERVEVLRGANSFINGAAPGGGGIGGAINLLPKRATSAALTQFTAGVESGGQSYLAADIGRRFGENDHTGIRLNAVRRQGDTSVDHEQRALSVFSAGLDYRGDHFRVSADIGHQDHQLDAPRPSVTIASAIALPVAPDASASFAQKWTRSNERDTFGTLRGEFDISDNVVAWGALGARSGSESNILAAPSVTSVDGSAGMYRFDNERRDSVRTGEIGIRAKLQTGNVGHSLSAVASGFWSESRNAYALSDFFVALIPTNIYQPLDAAAPLANFYTGGKLGAPLVTSKSILSSYAVADTVSFADDKVLLTIGARSQNIRDFSYNYNTGAQESGYDESVVTPLAAVVLKLNKDISLYANYTEGLQKGAVAAGTGVLNIGQAFAPYKAKQKEVGVKYDAGTFGVNAAVFTTAQPSAYVQDKIFGVFGEQRNRGLELSVFGQPSRGLRLLGGLTLLDATQLHSFGGTNDGKDAIGVPGTQLNAGVDWDVPGISGLAVSGRTIYTSSQFADAANLQRLPSWTRLDLSARYMTKIGQRDVTFRARVDNVTDKNYWASAGGYPGSGYLVLALPRTFTVSATVDF
jgi:iron complex outermembrane receptor protein